jgi:hypothetical protein
MPRTLGSITDAILTANEVEYWAFVKLILPAPIGTLRFTDRPGGFVGNVDGTSQTWVEVDVTHGPIRQSRQDIMIVNWVQFANLDFTWTNYALQYGLRNRQITIYTGWFDSVGAFVGSVNLFEGLTDEADCSDYCRLVLKPFSPPWDYKIPPAKMGGRCINDYRNPMDCQYAGAEPVGQVTCGKTRQHCRDRGNEININIYDDMPPDGQEITWGGESHGLVTAPK